MAIILSQELQNFSDVWPKTGRMHRTRVHFSENGFVALADKKTCASRAGSLGYACPAIRKPTELSADIQFFVFR